MADDIRLPNESGTVDPRLMPKPLRQAILETNEKKKALHAYDVYSSALAKAKDGIPMTPEERAAYKRGY